MSDPRIVTRRELAAALGLSPSRLDRVWRTWKTMRGFPGPAPGCAYLYDLAAFQAFLALHRPPELGGGTQSGNSASDRPDWSARMAAASDAVAGQV